MNGIPMTNRSRLSKDKHRSPATDGETLSVFITACFFISGVTGLVYPACFQGGAPGVVWKIRKGE